VAGRRELLEDGPGSRIVFDPADSAQPKSNALQPPRGLVRGIASKAWHDARSLTHSQLNDRPHGLEASGRRILGQHNANGGVRVLRGSGDDDAKVQRHHHARGLRHGFPNQVRHPRMRS